MYYHNQKLESDKKIVKKVDLNVIKKEIYMSHRAVVRETSHKQQNYAQLIICQQKVILKYAIKWCLKFALQLKKD